MLKHEKHPRLCFVGPMLGANPGWVVSQGEILKDLLACEGYPVRLTSAVPNRALRLVDTVKSLLAWRQQIDLVVLMVFSGPAFVMADIASLVTRWIGKPLVLWLHGGNLPEFSDMHPRWVSRILRRGNLIVSPSEYLAHHFRGYEFPVRVIPNVLKIEHYPFRYRSTVQPRLLWMRTFEDIYNPMMAVRVLGLVKQEFPQASLTMAGQDRGLLEPTRQFAGECGLSESVRFVGFLDMAGKQQEFLAHDIYLHTNQVDNMPVSVVEAAAFGLPIVATKVGGIPFLLKHEATALLVADGNAQDMAKAVTRLVTEPDLAVRLSEQGRTMAESCAWPMVKREWENLFSKFRGHG
jgi:glycosyltransferase involved in cell wall biosynthesis